MDIVPRPGEGVNHGSRLMTGCHKGSFAGGDSCIAAKFSERRIAFFVPFGYNVRGQNALRGGSIQGNDQGRAIGLTE